MTNDDRATGTATQALRQSLDVRARHTDSTALWRRKVGRPLMTTPRIEVLRHYLELASGRPTTICSLIMEVRNGGNGPALGG